MRFLWPSLLVLTLTACDDGDDKPELVDADGDGATADIDCDEADPAIFPGAAELCDGIDNDCNEVIDDNPSDAFVFYEDADADGYGGVNEVNACEQPSGYVQNSDDCNDNSDQVYPGASEFCDGLDNDCNLLVDDNPGDVLTFYADLDGDGYGNPDTTLEACTAPDNYVSDNTDCDDTNAALNPETRWYQDNDLDGYGKPQFYESGCDQPKGYVDNNEDCDDNSSVTFPGAAAEDPKSCMIDADGDGFGDMTPAVGVTAGTDCMDTDSSIFPGNTKEDPKACMQDYDYDGYGDAEPPEGVDAGTDCNDEEDDIYPGADEYCDGIDNDCNGVKDEDYALDALTWYTDGDGDGYGSSSSSTTVACYEPSGYSDNTDDCNDSRDDVNPSALEDCTDGVDNDCDSATDEECTYDINDANVTIVGANSYEYSGMSFAAGDLNGDGSEDLLIGAYAANSYMGRTSVMFGPISAGDYALDSDEDITFSAGGSSSSYSGITLEAGDIDGDGYDDMMIAGYTDSYVTSYAGGVYVFYGPLTAGTLGASDADAYIHGKSSYDYPAYYDGLDVYDADSDGVGELIVGAHNYERSSSYSTGIVSVFDVPSGNLRLDDGDYIFEGKDNYDYVGYSIGEVGDVNDDGYNDFAWGEPGDSMAWMVYGPMSSGAYDSDDADVIFQGSTSSSGAYYAGTDMTGGDFNDDGYADVVIGTMYDYGTSTYQGSVSVFYGPVSGTVSIGSDYDFKLYDESAYNYVGSAYYGSITVGDLNEDDADDLLVTNMYNDDAYASGGAGVVVYGPVSGLQSMKTYDVALYSDGDYGYLGRHSSVISDLDDNGSPDVVLGSYYKSSYAGETYIFFDNRF